MSVLLPVLNVKGEKWVYPMARALARVSMYGEGKGKEEVYHNLKCVFVILSFLSYANVINPKYC